jgi:cytochrome P450
VLLNLTEEEHDIINLLSVSKYLKYKDDDVWMREYLNKQLAKRRANEATDLEERYQRIVRKSRGRLSEGTMRAMAQKEHQDTFRHPRGP